MTSPQLATPSVNFERTTRLAPLGSFAMGIGWVRCSGSGDAPGRATETMLAIANGSDWTPQALTLHRRSASGSVQALPSWFSADYDHHMGLAVGDLNGTGYDDVVVAVFAGKDQDLSGGGVKVYRGGPHGLCPTPEWLARGFAATGVALADFTGTGTLDIVVSCLWEEGTIQAPGREGSAEYTGRARLLQNLSGRHASALRFSCHILSHPAARGAGDVTVADVDLDGTLDLVFSGPRTAVLYGDENWDFDAPFQKADSWSSEEIHPFSFGAQAIQHPRFPGSQLLVSSRGLCNQGQLSGRTLDQVSPCLLVHQPLRGQVTPALQMLAPFDPKRPEVPAGLAVAYDSAGFPNVVAGFLDARGKDIRGAPLRIFAAEFDAGVSRPFRSPEGNILPGGGLMAGRVVATPASQSEASVHECVYEVGRKGRVSLTLPCGGRCELLTVDVVDRTVCGRGRGRDLRAIMNRTSDGAALTFARVFAEKTTIHVTYRTFSEVDIAATSSAAWPPAGASGLWRGNLQVAAEHERRALISEVRRAG